MDRKKEFDKQFSLLCDVFKLIDPSFIDRLKKVTGRDKKEEQNPVEECENIDYDDAQVSAENTDWNDAETACADTTCNEVENTCTEDKDDTDFNEFDESNTGYLGFYLSKISLSADNNDCTTLNVLYVVNPDNFDKFTYTWMGDAFENACINNINENKIYGHIINRIHFAFYLIDDYNAGKNKEEDNILLKPDWVWDPDMLTFYADTKDDNMEYVRVVIEDKEDPYIHMRIAHVIYEDNSLKIDNITQKQRDEFILLLKDRVVKQEDDSGCSADNLLTAKDIATSVKLVNDTDVVVSCFCENRDCIDMDKCMKCPEKDNCRPKIEDYINMSRPYMVDNHQFKFRNEKDVKSITSGIYSLAAYANNPGNKEITNYWKGCIEKDIYLDSQNRMWGVDEFLDFMNNAVRYAIQNKKYTYSSDEASTTVCFNYMDMSKLYYDSTDRPELVDMLGMTHFDSDVKEHPSAHVLEEYKHELARFLCDRFNFNNVSILKDDKHNNFLIICDY